MVADDMKQVAVLLENICHTFEVNPGSHDLRVAIACVGFDQTIGFAEDVGFSIRELDDGWAVVGKIDNRAWAQMRLQALMKYMDNITENSSDY